MKGLIGLWFLVVLAVPRYGFSQPQVAAERMPASEQNKVIQTYCAVCHTDTSMTADLTLEHFDAANLDPSLAAMLRSKAKNGAFGAAGIKPPDRAYQDAFFGALAAESAGANRWTITRSQTPARSPMLTATVLRSAPSVMNAGDPDLYRLTLSCVPDSHEGEMKLTWAPWDVPLVGGTMSVASDEKAANTLNLKNGAGSTILANSVAGLPEQTLTIRTPQMSANQNRVDPLPDETVVFAFNELAPDVRQELSACFGSVLQGTHRRH